MTNEFQLQALTDEQPPIFRQSIGLVVIGLLGSGLLYCIVQVAIAQSISPYQANGSMIQRDQQIVGSDLVAQNFQTARYFHSRPSASNYDPMKLSGSNLAISNPDLQQLIEARRAAFTHINQIDPKIVPLEMLTASGSGIDPDISPASAKLQAKRIGNARGLNEQKILALIDKQTQSKQFGLYGQARINVLQLNLALDQL